MMHSETTSNSNDLAAELVAYIEADVALADDPIATDTDLLLSGLVDSLGVVLVTEWMQQRLGIEIAPVDIVLENFQTVDAMVDYARSRGAVTSP